MEQKEKKRRVRGPKSRMTPLRKARIRARLTQFDVAEEACISQEAYSRYERGERLPSVLMAIRIANILGVPIAKLRTLFRSDRFEARIHAADHPESPPS